MTALDALQTLWMLGLYPALYYYIHEFVPNYDWSFCEGKDEWIAKLLVGEFAVALWPVWFTMWLIPAQGKRVSE